MTPAQIRIVQQTFSKIEADSIGFSALFYDRMFAIAPETRALFRDDLKSQHAKFMKVIAEVVQLHLRALISLPVTAKAGNESAIPGAYWAGKMHFAYGVKTEHYEIMKEALFWALQRSLENEFTEETLQAWNTAYDILAKAMKEGMVPDATDPDAPELDETRTSREEVPEQTQQAAAFLKGLGER